MAITYAIVPVLIAQSALSLGLDSESEARAEAEVGYEQLEAGDAYAAIAAIEAGEGVEQQDPAALINLGNAYARVGMTSKALAYYRAAIDSPEHYELELSDGKWMDSRKAAKLAQRALIRDSAQAIAD